MSTRDLATNSMKSLNKAEAIINFTSKELIGSYKTALIDVRSKLAELYSRFMTLEEPTKAHTEPHEPVQSPLKSIPAGMATPQKLKIKKPESEDPTVAKGPSDETRPA